MGFKKKLEVVFVVAVTVLVIGLAYIGFASPSDEESTFPMDEKSKDIDYLILDKSESCDSMKEVFYEDDDNIYYFPCTKSNTIYLQWKNGEINLMKDELESGKVTIASLMEHGLPAQVDSKHEENKDVEEVKSEEIKDVEVKPEENKDEVSQPEEIKDEEVKPEEIKDED